MKSADSRIDQFIWMGISKKREQIAHLTFLLKIYILEEFTMIFVGNRSCLRFLKFILSLITILLGIYFINLALKDDVKESCELIKSTQEEHCTY